MQEPDIEPQESDGDPFNRAFTMFQDARRLMELADYQQAADLLRQSSILHPHYKTLQLLGECLLRLGRYSESVVFLAAATTLNAQPRAPMLLAEALLALGDSAAAKSAIDTALERSPRYRLALALAERINTAEQQRVDGIERWLEE